jgi:hypothetical protein
MKPRSVAQAAAVLTALALSACAGPAGMSTARQATVPADPASAPQPAAVTDGTATICPAAGAIMVSSASELRQALAAASPGQVIVLAPGEYRGHFVAATSGTAAQPITLCGPRSAVLDGGGIDSGYTLHLSHASWWRVAGFTVTSGQKGVMTDQATHDLITGLYVHGTGDEAIHLRDFSSDDAVSGNVVRDTGLLVHSYGEGIYVGTAHKNWCKYSGCQPDNSDRDVISGNDIANTTAENIDIKEGTTGGKIIGNQLNGTGMDPSAATAWINVKGNGWLIQANTGTDSVKDGLQVHKVYDGWGYGNVFKANKLRVNGPGYGIYVQSKHLNTVVSCDNVAIGAGRGLSTLACTRSR